MSSAELDRLLADEIGRRMSLVADLAAPVLDLRAALHSLRGAAAMAGYSDLALVLAQFGARLRAGDDGVRPEIAEVLAVALERLDAGEPPFRTRWPQPPPGMTASPIDGRYRAEYHGAMRDRLGELDAVLASTSSSLSALESAQRSVHAMKGAAAAAGDDVTAWYCHGLETRLRELPRDDRQAKDALVELARHRALLAVLAEDPARGLDLLSVSARASGSSPAFTLGARRPRTQPPTHPPESGRPLETAELRVPERTVERFLERLDRLDGVHDALARGSDVARRLAARLLELRLTVLDAVRRIGPARPWGPPLAALQQLETTAEALRRAAARADRGARTFRSDAESMRARVGAMRGELAQLRRTSMSWLFERVSRATARFGEAEGKLVQVATAGGEVSVERRIAERLIDPVLQLVRNAVAHGIGTPEQRRAQGKPPTGTITLRAARRGAWLRVAVEDDGRGVDVERIRELAVARGLVSPALAERAQQAELLLLLFAPGLSTAEGSDLLAGRGLGLDIVQDAMRRLGGAASLQQRPEGGLCALLEVPLDHKLASVLWIEEAGHEYALPVSFTGRVVPIDASAPPQRLGTCLGLASSLLPKLGLELVVHGLGSVVLGVDGVGAIEEASIRSVGPLLAAAGPYSGAVLRSDGSLRLVLDGPTLAAQVRAFGA